ncbi:MAG TPA: hypothetical protein VLM79_17030 [Kofleriaceae bacterium]|nr:hypothetical protein [Kofleriaceae bacterium]
MTGYQKSGENADQILRNLLPDKFDSCSIAPAMTIITSRKCLLLGCIIVVGTSCGVDSMGKEPGSGSDPVDPAPAMFQEVALTVMTKLTITPGNGTDVPAVATLDITARDGTTPVITDLWLYTIDATGAQVPLTGFTSTANRRSPKLMLPATIKGQPSGLSPADDGRQNGLMTNTSRGSMRQGAFVSAVTGTVVVTLPAVPTLPILVVAGVEDQRYAGAAVINPDGSLGTVPAGVGSPETHVRRTFARDVEPIVQMHCGGCHKPNHTYLAKSGGTRDELINDNFGLALATRTCQRNTPDGGAMLDQCIQGITAAAFLVEPGAPAVSPWLTRTRPDEDGNASVNGLKWWGTNGSRFVNDYGDHRMPSTTESSDPAEWTNQPTDFDDDPATYMIVWEWVAQGAAP